MWEEKSLQVEDIKGVGMFDLSIKISSNIACVEGFQSAVTMNSIVMVGEYRGGGNCLLTSFKHSNMLLCFMLVWMVKGSASAWVSWGSSSGFCHRPAPEVMHIYVLNVHSFPSAVCGISSGVRGIPTAVRVCGILSEVRGISAAARGKPSTVHIRGTPSAACGIPLATRSTPSAICGIHFAVGGIPSDVRGTPSAMPRPRQRMLSRRGSGWGNTSHPSSGSGSMGQDPRPHGIEGILRPSQFLDPSSPGYSNSPSFSSAIFSFNCSLNRPRITAHVSILFLEEAQDEGDPSAPMPLTEEDQNPNTLRPIADMQLGTTPQASAVNVNPGAHALPDRHDHATAQDQDLNEGGWCRIVEESPDK